MNINDVVCHERFLTVSGLRKHIALKHATLDKNGCLALILDRNIVSNGASCSA